MPPPQFAFLPLCISPPLLTCRPSALQFRPLYPLEAAFDCEYVKAAISGRPRRIFIVVVVVVDRNHLVYVGFEASRAQRETCVVLLCMEGGGREEMGYGLRTTARNHQD